LEQHPIILEENKGLKPIPIMDFAQLWQQSMLVWKSQRTSYSRQGDWDLTAIATSSHATAMDGGESIFQENKAHMFI
jgi:hypothetical protein